MDSMSVIAMASIFSFIAYKLYHAHQSMLHEIPTIGWSIPGLSYLSAINFVFNSKRILQEGYDKHKDGLFKIPLIDRWTVIVNSPKLIEELHRAPDDQLDFNEASFRSIEAWFTFGPSIVQNHYHTAIVSSHLHGRNLIALFPDIRDELVKAFTDIIPTTKGNEWVKVPVKDAALKIVCRTGNRVFVGPEKCRDLDWIALNTQFTIDVVTSALIINRFPGFMKPLAGRIFSKLPSSVRRAERHLGPIVNERRKMMAVLGDDWTDKPNDVLMWLMENAEGDEVEVRNLATRMLAVNFVAVHTSSLTFTQALYELASRPEYIKPLREEVDAIVSSEGWSKESLSKMRKIDSFLRESQRFNGFGLFVLSRYAHKPFTFSNGITIPKGTVLHVPLYSIHHDEEYFPSGDAFHPWRFSDMRDRDDDEEREGSKYQMVSTTLDTAAGPFLTFGHGRHAWYAPLTGPRLRCLLTDKTVERDSPGRFFAALELKAMLAHVVAEYDIKLEDGASRPQNTYIGPVILPARANVMFRKRQKS